MIDIIRRPALMAGIGGEGRVIGEILESVAGNVTIDAAPRPWLTCCSTVSETASEKISAARGGRRLLQLSDSMVGAK